MPTRSSSCAGASWTLSRPFIWPPWVGARALDLEDRIGSFRPGCEADFVALDLHATPFLQFRTEQCTNLFETLFVLNTLGG